MKPSRFRVFALLSTVCAIASAFAQDPAAAPAARPPAGRGATASPALVSPEVHPDRRVTFRVAAPKATEVSLTSDWQTGTKQMEKGADGAWSITVGPLAPSSYIYSFNVDGIAVADPVNPRIKLRARGSGSIVEVPSGGATPALDEVRAVPHGKVEINWHKAATLAGETRSFWVYTPPDYSADPGRRYPVLYLLHGNNDRPNGWIDVGNLNLLMDNLLAEKKVVPMIIVMPFGHVLPYGQNTQGGRSNNAMYEDYLIKDVIPHVETNYRVVPERARRAIAGFSMGGGQSMSFFFRHLDVFSSLAAMAPATGGTFATDNATLLNDAAGTNAKIDLLWLGCGRQDSLHANAQQLADTFAAKQIRHTWFSVDGVHNYAFIRGALPEFLPKLFRKP
ncbi:MAG: alpha/beta hydrolase-fold protein [Opitutaceae bacterium]